MPADLPSGARLFARYAYAPNALGFCGPADAASLLELAATGHTTDDISAVAARFSGAWPYLVLLAELAGIDDPLAEPVVRAYWTGGPLLDSVDRAAFGARLVEHIGAQAGHYWQHVDAGLLPEAVATHGFHVFGVYPWSRLLDAGPSAQPLHVLDSCRIRWGEVVTADDRHVVVRSQRLSWDGRRLALTAEGPEQVARSAGGRSLVDDPRPGDLLALHWDRICDRLTTADRDVLERWTHWQLEVTNARLARLRFRSGV